MLYLAYAEQPGYLRGKIMHIERLIEHVGDDVLRFHLANGTKMKKARSSTPSSRMKRLRQKRGDV